MLDQVADALDVAPSERRLLRSVDPGMIMTSTEGGSEWVRILDFRLAKMLDADPEKSDDLVHTGAAVVQGSAPYMSPDQASGKQVSHLTDVYSLAVTLFHVLTGKPP